MAQALQGLIAEAQVPVAVRLCSIVLRGGADGAAPALQWADDSHWARVSWSLIGQRGTMRVLPATLHAARADADGNLVVGLLTLAMALARTDKLFSGGREPSPRLSSESALDSAWAQLPAARLGGFRLSVPAVGRRAGGRLTSPCWGRQVGWLAVTGTRPAGAGRAGAWGDARAQRRGAWWRQSPC